MLLVQILDFSSQCFVESELASDACKEVACGQNILVFSLTVYHSYTHRVILREHCAKVIDHY